MSVPKGVYLGSVVKSMFGNQKEIRKALRNLAKVTSFRYKKFFVVPDVKVTWVQGRMTGAKAKREFGGLYFSINGVPIRGHIQFDHAFFFQKMPETQRWLNAWLSERLTRVINSIEVGASMDRARAKRVVERTFNLKVK